MSHHEDDESAPRMCGDDPEGSGSYVFEAVCSPHVRG